MEQLFYPNKNKEVESESVFLEEKAFHPVSFLPFHDGLRGTQNCEILPWSVFMPHCSRYIILKGAKIPKDQANAPKIHRPSNSKAVIYNSHEELI